MHVNLWATLIGAGLGTGPSGWEGGGSVLVRDGSGRFAGARPQTAAERTQVRAVLCHCCCREWGCAMGSLAVKSNAWVSAMAGGCSGV